MMINTLEQALQEQLNEVPKSINVNTQALTNLKPNETVLLKWSEHTWSAASRGDRTYMEDFLNVTQLKSEPVLKIEDWAQVLYFAMSLLGDILFFLRSGATLVCGLHYQNKLLVGNVGDSRANIFIQSEDKPQLLRLNRTHKVSNQIEKERIEKESKKWGNKNLDYLFLSRGIGGFSYCPLVTYEPEISFLSIEATPSILLLCSDGVSDVLNEKELLPIFLEPNANMHKKIHDASYLRFKQSNTDADNISLILHDLNPIDSPILMSISDGCGGDEAAKQATALLPFLIDKKILDFVNQYVPWREIYNDHAEIFEDEWIKELKSVSSSISTELICGELSLTDGLSTWFNLKKQTIAKINAKVLECQ